MIFFWIFETKKSEKNQIFFFFSSVPNWNRSCAYLKINANDSKFFLGTHNYQRNGKNWGFYKFFTKVLFWHALGWPLRLFSRCCRLAWKPVVSPLLGLHILIVSQTKDPKPFHIIQRCFHPRCRKVFPHSKPLSTFQTNRWTLLRKAG